MSMTGHPDTARWMDDEAIRDYYRSDAKRRDLVHCETVWFVHEQVWSELEALDAAF